MTKLEGPAPGFYGTDWATYYVTESGRIWLVQSDDVEARYLPREVQALDDRAEPIPFASIGPDEATALTAGITED